MSKGERNLDKLLAGLNPTLSKQRYAFELTDQPVLDEHTFALVREHEAVTAIRVSPAGEWARISLGAHSSLDAVGLTAAFATALSDVEISSNVVTAFYHDHIFVQWHRREEALKVLRALA